MALSDMDGIIPLSDAVGVHRNNYDSGDTDYSVTTLLDPPRVVHLNKRHLSKCDMFVKEQLSSFIGTAIHQYFEFCLRQVVDKPYKYEMEQRLFTVVLDRKISGMYDLVKIDENDNRDMTDYKTTSCWKARFGDMNDWTAQQNIYRLLYWIKNKKGLRTIRVVAIYLDWSINNKMRYGKGYPNEKSIEYTLPVWGMKKTMEYLEERVGLMKQYEKTPDDSLPKCTWEEMWCKEDKCAVIADNRKNALRVLPNEKAAEEWLNTYLASDNCKHNVLQLHLDLRSSVRTRCEHWCPVNKYCNQYHEYLKSKATMGN